MGFRMFAMVLALSLGTAAFADDSGPAPVKPARRAAGPKKHSDLTWAKGVADDFLAAWVGGDNAEAEMLFTEELKKRYERYPQGTSLATRLLDGKSAGLAAGTITNEQIAPDEDEARFTGKLTGERNGKPIEAEFALRVVKESGKWRIAYFRQQWRWVEPNVSPGK
jgi:hypothetical protein